MALDTHREALEATAMALARPGSGLLAADESTGTIGKRFAAIGVENTEANRRAYRTLLATAPGLGEAISGVILYEETLYQDAAPLPGQPGASILDLFQAQGLVAGIKLDLGLEPLAGGLPGETWCTGLKGLRERAARAYARGARFAKWRAVLRISADGCPSELCVRENAWGLARYARNKRLADALAQQAFAALSSSPGARACYDTHRANGDGHYKALRALSNRLVGILHGCLRHRTLYDEHTAWAGRSTAHSVAA